MKLQRDALKIKRKGGSLLEECRKGILTAFHRIFHKIFLTTVSEDDIIITANYYVSRYNSKEESTL